MGYADTYREIGLSTEVMGADPWQQVKLLLDKLKACIVDADKALTQQDIALKCKKILRAHDIVIYLRESLNFEGDAVLAKKLDGIYGHMERLLFQANAKNDQSLLSEAATISQNLINWWTHVQSE